MEGRPCEYEALDVVSRDTPAGDDYRLFIAVAGRTTRQMLRRTAVSTSRYSGCAFPCRVGLISDAKPGNQDYNGGRRIRAEINHVALCPQHAHADEDGDLNPANLFSTGDFFECPLLPRRGNSPSQELSLMEQAPLVAAPIVRGATRPASFWAGIPQRPRSVTKPGRLHSWLARSNANGRYGRSTPMNERVADGRFPCDPGPSPSWRLLHYARLAIDSQEPGSAKS